MREQKTYKQTNKKKKRRFSLSCVIVLENMKRKASIVYLIKSLEISTKKEQPRDKRQSKGNECMKKKKHPRNNTGNFRRQRHWGFPRPASLPTRGSVYAWPVAVTTRRAIRPLDSFVLFRFICEGGGGDR